MFNYMTKTELKRFITIIPGTTEGQQIVKEHALRALANKK